MSSSSLGIGRVAIVVIVVIIIIVAGVAGYALTIKPSSTTTSNTSSNALTSSATSVNTATTSSITTTNGSFSYPIVANVSAAAMQALYPTTPVTINEYAWSGYPPTAMVTQFEAAFPNIHVAQTPDQNPSGLLSALETHTYVYDSFRIQYLQLPQEISTGEVANITNYINSYFPDLKTQIAASAQTLVDGGSPGSWYCIPEDLGPVALNYNQVLFTKYHLQVPSTWTQFMNDSTVLHSENSSVYMTVFPPNEPSGDLMGLFWQAGGNMITPVNSTAYDVVINSTTNLDVANYWGSLITSGKVQSINLYSNQFNSELQDYQIASFATAAAWYPEFVVQSTAPAQSGQWRVAPMPQWAGLDNIEANSNVTGVVGGSCMGVTTNAKNPGASMLFGYYIDQTINAIPYMWVNGGQWTSNTVYLQSVSNFTQPNAYFGGQNIGAVYIQSQKEVNPNWVWSPFEITLQTILQNYLNEAASGQITYAQALQYTETTMIGIVQDNGYIVAGVGH
jgi:multiple sugar transport system substrate-binding protein